MEYKSDCLITNPLVSVFIFTYNQEILVSKTIDSILSQKTDFPFEIVLIDDCSTDRTKEKCLEYFEKYPEQILFVENDINKGLIKNYHESIETYARGKYIAQCAGDDWWIDDLKLQKQTDFLESHPDYDLIHTRTLIFIEDTGKYFKRTGGQDRNQFEKMIICTGICALTACFRKSGFFEYIHEIDPIKQNFPGEDYPMWIWFSFRKKIHFSDEITTVYRMRKESLSNSVRPDRKHIIEKERRDIKMFFYNHFKVSKQDILYQINLRCMLDTMRTASIVHDKENMDEQDTFFLHHKLYHFYILSHLYRWAGMSCFWNNKLFFLERVMRRLDPSRKYYV